MVDSLESFTQVYTRLLNELCLKIMCQDYNSSSKCTVLTFNLSTKMERFVTLVSRVQREKTVLLSHKFYDFSSSQPDEVNEIRAERLEHTTNSLALVAQQQPVYHHQETIFIMSQAKEA
ncbi:hypothetical protein Tco_0474680 [Tanacetum coccineum]